MKLVVVGPTHPFRGGVAHFTTLLVQNLRDRHEVRFLSYRKQYPAWLYPGNAALDPTAMASSLTTPCERFLVPWNPLTWLRATTLIRRDQPDVLLLQWWTPFWSPLLFFLTRRLGRRRPRVFFLCHHVLGPDGGILDRLLAHRVLRRGDAHIVMSPDDAASLARVLPRATIREIRHPPYDALCRGSMSRESARAELDLGTDEPVLLFFGFVRPYKGLAHLLEAMALAREHLPVRLLVVGEFWDDERPYRERVRTLGLQAQVRFHSSYVHNDEIAKYFSASDVVVLPYLAASDSGVAQLAIGFERPIIATAVGGIPSTVRDGETGLIVSPGDSRALAVAIVRFFRDRLGEVFAPNLREVKRSASWRPLVELIETLAAGRV